MGFDVPCAADLFESYAGLPDKISGKCFGTLPDNVTLQIREPMGVIAAIVPWNFPLTNAAIKLAPILACGNTVVLKPSEVSPLVRFDAGEAGSRCWLSAGSHQCDSRHGPRSRCSTGETSGRGQNHVHRTTSNRCQMLEAAKVGMKGVMLELGGKTPSIVFPDAPIDNVVNGVITGIFYNLGQVCVAGSRLLIHESQHDDLLERIVAKVRSLRQGDPTDPDTQLGCLATPGHCNTVRKCVEKAEQEGARCVLTGNRPVDSMDCFYPPTVFDRVTPGMTVAREEVFGPVLSVMTYRDEAEAVRMANDCEFGLMANIWTSDGTQALRVARQIRAGRIAINGGGALRANVPVFGYKLSGIGAELGFDEAVHEYCSSKAILYSLATEKSAWPD